MAHEERAVGISSVRGLAVWSAFDPGIDRYRLRLYAHGVVRTLEVRPRLVPFDADLAIDARGRTVAVYSRCRHESPNWLQASGCDLYELAITRGAERKLRGPSAPSRDEFMPSLDGERIAFARRNEDAVGAAAVAPALRLYNFRTRRTSALPEGTRGDYTSLDPFEGPADWIGGPGPTGLDLRGEALALTWGFVDDSCDPRSTWGEWTTRHELWVMSTTGKRALVERGTCDDRDRRLSSPVLTASSVLYLAGSGDRMTLTRFARRSHEVTSGLGSLESVGGSERALFAIQYGTPGTMDILRIAPEFA